MVLNARHASFACLAPGSEMAGKRNPGKRRSLGAFSTWWFNRLWEYELKIDKDNTDYGYYDKYHRFVWKESFLPLVQEFCQKNAMRLR